MRVQTADGVVEVLSAIKSGAGLYTAACLKLRGARVRAFASENRAALVAHAEELLRRDALVRPETMALYIVVACASV